MTIPSQFAGWLSVSERDGLGGKSAEPPAIRRGRKLTMKLNLPLDPAFGDWTLGTFAARLRAAPGAEGSPLASYDCTIGTPAGGVTPIEMVLEAADQSGLPASDPASGLVELFLDVTYTIAGTEETLISTRQLVVEVV
jgi:hypothetical protein